MAFLIDWIRRRLIGPTLLEDITRIPLEASLEDAVAAYGDPTDSKPNDDLPQSTEYSFHISDYHDVVTWVWKEKVHAILYLSSRGQPELDLETMRKSYGNGQDWITVNEGYLYRRRDGKVRLWCSAIPAIGVGTEEYFQAENEHKRARAAGSNSREPA